MNPEYFFKEFYVRDESSQVRNMQGCFNVPGAFRMCQVQIVQTPVREIQFIKMGKGQYIIKTAPLAQFLVWVTNQFLRLSNNHKADGKNISDFFFTFLFF